MKPVPNFLFSLLPLTGLLSALGANEIRIGPNDDWFAVLHGSGLHPGDTVTLKEGTYSHPRRLVLQHRGTGKAPITIRGEKGKRVLFQRPDAKQDNRRIE